MKIGANYSKDGRCYFTVWAPFAHDISLTLISPVERLIPMQKDESGYWRTEAVDVYPGAQYYYRIDDERERPDPASFYQPEGVHTASEVIDHNTFEWHDEEWKGISLSEMVMYEMHIGTFTEQGTFEAVVPLLDELRDIGINAIEIMPVAQFPGKRNWGYDGVYPFAVQNSYGGPDGLRYLVNECHKRDIAVILDVVYNHFGPEGNYIWDYGPYFTERYKTPWGNALNFDGPHSNQVRDYFIQNAFHWFGHYHVDGLRLDAVHGIYDMSARHFLRELSERVAGFSKVHGRKFHLIAESDMNNALLAETTESGGFGIDGLWSDDFHHALHTLLTGEDSGYYLDFGKVKQIQKAMKEGFVYSGQYSPYRKRNHGNSSKDLPADRLIVFSQNHDQIGNRMKGERLASLVSFEAQKLIAGVVILSPYVPILFMGEEYGETAPFLYFVSHSDENLIEGVRQGRKKEFGAFNWTDAPPDPQSEDTFIMSRIDRKKSLAGNNKILLSFYKKLIKLKKEMTPLLNLDKNNLEVLADEEDKILSMRRWQGAKQIFAIFNFNKKDIIITQPVPDANWEKILDSSGNEWNGPGSLLPECPGPGTEMKIQKESFVLYAADM